MRSTMAAVLTAGLLLAGCGERQAETESSERVPITPRAVAAVMLDHVSGETTRREATYVDEHSPKGLVGADFRYHGDGEYDGDLVRVTVSKAPPAECDDGLCADLGEGVTLQWDELTPEEDPGIVLVQLDRGDQVVSALYAGPSITKDPRELDLEPSVPTLAELVRDPRLRLSTDAETVDAGEALEDWDGGEVDPADLERVPNDDATVVVGWIWGYADGWEYVGPSPLKDVFGDDAIGGRVRVTGDLDPLTSGYLDALAAPRPPAWLKRGCLEGYRCETRRGLTLVWRPAEGTDPGDAFVVHVRPDGETVAFHSEGNRLGESYSSAAGPAGLYFWGPDLTDTEYNELTISLTTTREKFERASKLARQTG